MTKEKLLAELRMLDELKAFHEYVSDAKAKGYDVKVKVKNRAMDMFGEIFTWVAKLNLSSDALLIVLKELIKKKEEEIDKEIKYVK